MIDEHHPVLFKVNAIGGKEIKTGLLAIALKLAKMKNK